MFDFLKNKEVIYELPTVMTSTSSKKTSGFTWYEVLIDYHKVSVLTEGYIGKVAVLDDTAHVTNDYLKNSVDTVYDFTGEGGNSSYHGHHVSGIISSQKHGLFKNHRIGFFKVLSAVTGQGSSKWLVKAIDACIIEGYEVINASLGSPTRDNALTKAITNYCANPKNFFIAAAGNENRGTSSPANLAGSIKGVISVGALGYENDEYIIPTFSNFGNVTIIAPAVDILSTFPNNQEEILTGTSMATPFVSGLIASSKAIYPEFDHTTFDEVIHKVTHEVKGPKNKQGLGFVKVVDFLEEVHNIKVRKGVVEKLEEVKDTASKRFLCKLKSRFNDNFKYINK